MGGLSMGLCDAGFHIASGYDTSSTALRAFRLNLPTARALNRCIERASSWRDEALEGCAVMAAGWPCPEFSICGPGNPCHSARGRLILGLMQSGRSSLPEVFIGECVDAFAVSDHGRPRAFLHNAFSDLGYDTHDYITPAQGAPMSRTRYFLIAVRRDLAQKITEPEMARIMRPMAPRRSTLAEWGVLDSSLPLDEQRALDMTPLDHEMAKTTPDQMASGKNVISECGIMQCIPPFSGAPRTSRQISGLTV